MIAAARLKVASAVVENAIFTGAPGAVTLVDWRFRRVDKQLGVGKYLRAVHADNALTRIERVVGGEVRKGECAGHWWCFFLILWLCSARLGHKFRLVSHGLYSAKHRFSEHGQWQK